VEAAVGLLWVTVAWRSYIAFFPIVYAAGLMIFVWLMVALAILDAEHLWLPDSLTIPGILLGLLWWILGGLLVGHALKMPWETKDLKEIGLRILGILLAAGLILLIRWTYQRIRKHEGLGLGDAKLMAMLAAWLGLPLTLLAFVIGVLLGSLAALVLLARPALQRDGETWALSKLPLGTFLCIGGIVSSLCGQPILDAYLRWAGF
jgi:leader peptidase (prepilin peptidase)/N-methyltransferase